MNEIRLALNAALRGMDLSGVIVPDVGLKGLIVKAAGGARLELIGADLSGTDLSGAMFTGVNIAATRLVGANLYGARFEDCDLTCVSFRGAYLERTRFVRCKLSAMDGREANAKEVEFNDCEVADSVFRDARLESAKFAGGTVSNLDFSGARLNKVRFTNGATLQGLLLTRAQMVEAVFEGTTFEDSTLFEVDLSKSRWSKSTVRRLTLRGGVMTGIYVSKCQFDGVCFEQTKVSFERVQDSTFQDCQIRWEMSGRTLFMGATFSRCSFGVVIDEIPGIRTATDEDATHTMRLRELEVERSEFLDCRFGRIELDDSRISNTAVRRSIFEQLRLIGVYGPNGVTVEECQLGVVSFQLSSECDVTIRNSKFSWVFAHDARFKNLACYGVDCVKLLAPRAQVTSGEFRDTQVAAGSLRGASLNATRCSRVQFPGVALDGATLNDEPLEREYP
jgi:uncharacterized protein YjbI with pentapeptide repeats